MYIKCVSNFVIIWTLILSITFMSTNFVVVGQKVLGPYTRLLDPDTGYILEWRVNMDQNSITFNITTRANIYSSIVFGLMRKERLKGADVVVFGVNQDGSSYIHDMHGGNNSTLKYDVRQNWKLISGQRLPGGRTFVSLSRSLDTCDVDQDLIISRDLIYVTWGTLRNGDLRPGYQGTLLPIPLFSPLGSLPIYFLDKEIPHLNPVTDPALQTWRFARELHVPARHTSYWCSIQRGPKLQRKMHIVGFGTYFKDKQSEKHVHHQVAYRCHAPSGVDPVSFFDSFADDPGQECYLNEGDTPAFPMVPFCREVIYLWGVGGYDYQLPDNVGFALSEDANEYFMMETHYDNPEIRSDLIVENGVDFHYTPKIREKDGGMVFVGYGVVTDVGGSGSVFAVPPHSTEFTIAGQCSPQCTKDIVPRSGIEIFAVTLHAHIAARKMRLRHFRGNKELPLIQIDENNDFNFQQMRLLPEPVTIFPGDHIVAECVYDTSWKNGSTVSGFSTRDEMCNAFIYWDKRAPFMFCSSEYPSEKVLSRFGVRNVTWDLESYERIVTSSTFSQKHVGHRFSEVVDLLSYNWSPAQRQTLQAEMQYSEHVASCPSLVSIAQSALQSVSSGGVSSNDIMISSSSSSVRYPRNATPAYNYKPSPSSPCSRKSFLPFSTTPTTNFNLNLGLGPKEYLDNRRLKVFVPHFSYNSSTSSFSQMDRGRDNTSRTRGGIVIQPQQHSPSAKSFQHNHRIW